VDIRADIYSLGATFYYLLTGHPPFGGATSSPNQLLPSSQEVKPIREVRPEVPEPLAAVIAQMMALDPGQRYATPEAVTAALSVFANDPVPPPPEAEMPCLSLAASLLEFPKSTAVSPRLEVPRETRPTAVVGSAPAAETPRQDLTPSLPVPSPLTADVAPVATFQLLDERPTSIPAEKVPATEVAAPAAKEDAAKDRPRKKRRKHKSTESRALETPVENGTAPKQRPDRSEPLSTPRSRKSKVKGAAETSSDPDRPVEKVRSKGDPDRPRAKALPPPADVSSEQENVEETTLVDTRRQPGVPQRGRNRGESQSAQPRQSGQAVLEEADPSIGNWTGAATAATLPRTQPEERHKNRTFVMVAIALGVVAVCSAVIGFIMTRSEKEEPVLVNASGEELVQAFRTNEIAANQKYRGKKVEIRGVYAEYREKEEEVVLVVSKTEQGRVYCRVLEKDLPEVSQFKKGDKLLVKGICDGAKTHPKGIEVKKCEFSK